MKEDFEIEAIRLESARMVDSKDFADLIEISAGEFVEKLLGPAWRETIYTLYSHSSTIFGAEKTTFARLGKENLGMYIGFSPWRSIMSYARTGWVCLRFLRKRTSPRLSRLLAVERLSSFAFRTFYIGSIAVKEEYRGNGIGRLLLSEAERNAERRRLRRVCMDVVKENAAAIGFCVHMGYAPSPRTRVLKLAGRNFEFLRMEKLLSDE